MVLLGTAKSLQKHLWNLYLKEPYSYILVETMYLGFNYY